MSERKKSCLEGEADRKKETAFVKKKSILTSTPTSDVAVNGVLDEAPLLLRHVGLWAGSRLG